MSTLLKGLILLLLQSHIAVAQTVKCVTIGDGCDDGTTHDATVKSAIAKFKDNKLYGNSNNRIVFSSSLGSDGTLAQISYSCTDGSIPPTVLGSSARSYVESILTCANQCGSVAHPQNANCGFGLLLATDADTTSCFSKAINVAPTQFDPIEKPSDGAWQSRGCYIDLTNNERALKGGSFYATDMTVSKCVARAAGFKYAGLTGSTECYWGNEISSSATTATAGDCNVPCGGLITEACGATRRIRIYQNTAYSAPISTTTRITTTILSTPTATIVPSVDSYKTPTCYTEDKNSRVLVNGSKSDNSATGMTVEDCADLAVSWRYSGVTAGGDCYWGDALMHSAKADSDECRANSCAGDSSEACGASNRILVYEDEDFVIPSRLDVADIVDEYIKALAELQGLILQWNDLLQQYFDQGGTDVATRDLDLSLLIPAINQVRVAMAALRTAWRLRRRLLHATGLRGNRYARLQESESIRLNNLGSSAESIISDVEAVGPGASQEALKLSTAAKATIGAFVGVGLASSGGLFEKALELIHNLRGSPDEPPPEDPANPGIPPLPTWPAEDIPPQVCEQDTCNGGGECTDARKLFLRILEQRTPPAEAPGDIDEHIDTTPVTNSADFTEPTTVDSWWRRVKRLLWQNGSHHGWAAPGQPSRYFPSSLFVPFTDNPMGNLFTGAGPVYGCTALVVVSERGAYTAHFWERFFTEPGEFEPNVIDFLTWGNFEQGQAYQGLAAYLGPGGAFDGTDVLFAGIMTPERTVQNVQGVWNPATPQVERYPAHAAVLQAEVARLLNIPAENIPVAVYPYDREIWRLDFDWVTMTNFWRAVRNVRLTYLEFLGMLTVQRRATQDPNVTPAVRVMFNNNVLFQAEWDRAATTTTAVAAAAAKATMEA